MPPKKEKKKKSKADIEAEKEEARRVEELAEKERERRAEEAREEARVAASLKKEAEEAARVAELAILTHEEAEEVPRAEIRFKLLAEANEAVEARRQWETYIACTNGPELPAAQSDLELNTYLSQVDDEWSATAQPSLDQALRAIATTERIVAALDDAKADAKARGDEAMITRCAGFVEQLRDASVKQLDRATATVLLHADELSQLQDDKEKKEIIVTGTDVLGVNDFLQQQQAGGGLLNMTATSAFSPKQAGGQQGGGAGESSSMMIMMNNPLSKTAMGAASTVNMMAASTMDMMMAATGNNKSQMVIRAGQRSSANLLGENNNNSNNNNSSNNNNNNNNNTGGSSKPSTPAVINNNTLTQQLLLSGGGGAQQVAEAEVDDEAPLMLFREATRVGIWANLTMKTVRGPFKQLHFSQIDANVDLPKNIGTQRLGARILYLPYSDHCSEAYRTAPCWPERKAGVGDGLLQGEVLDDDLIPGDEMLFLGATVQLEVLELPPPPREIKPKWSMQPITGLSTSVNVQHFPLGSEPGTLVPLAELRGSASGAPNQYLRCRFRVAEHVIVPEHEVRVAWFDPARRMWLDGTTFQVEYNAAKREVAFNAARSGMLALVQPRALDLPYLDWALTPSLPCDAKGPSDVEEPCVRLTLKTQRFTVVLEVRAEAPGKCRLLEPADLAELKPLTVSGVYLSPGRMLSALARAGIHVQPLDADVDATNNRPAQETDPATAEEDEEDSADESDNSATAEKTTAAAASPGDENALASPTAPSEAPPIDEAAEGATTTTTINDPAAADGGKTAATTTGDEAADPSSSEKKADDEDAPAGEDAAESDSPPARPSAAAAASGGDKAATEVPSKKAAVGLKSRALEAKLCSDVAQLAAGYDFAACPAGRGLGPDRVAVQFRETSTYVGNGLQTLDFMTVLVEADAASKTARETPSVTLPAPGNGIKATLVQQDPAFDLLDEAPLDDSLPHLYLRRTLEPVSSASAIRRIDESPLLFQQTVEELLRLTRPFSFY